MPITPAPTDTPGDHAGDPEAYDASRKTWYRWFQVFCVELVAYIDTVIAAATDAANAVLTSKITGPASAMASAFAKFDGITGKLVKVSFLVEDDSGNLTTEGQIYSNGRGNTRGFCTPDWRMYNTSSNALVFNNGSDRVWITGAGNFTPGLDNAQTMGSAAYRWSQAYAAIGTINTSDAREKTDVRVMAADEIEATKALSNEIGVYQFLSSVAEKGDKARHHIGMTVQRAIEIMRHHGLDPFSYGFICYDKWDDVFVDHPAIEAREAVLDESGNVVEPAIDAQDAWTEQTLKAGDRYSFRYDQLTLFIARGIDARLAALEAA